MVTRKTLHITNIQKFQLKSLGLHSRNSQRNQPNTMNNLRTSLSESCGDCHWRRFTNKVTVVMLHNGRENIRELFQVFLCVERTQPRGEGKEFQSLRNSLSNLTGKKLKADDQLNRLIKLPAPTQKDKTVVWNSFKKGAIHSARSAQNPIGCGRLQEKESTGVQELKWFNL